jgi:1,4-dihydroxy-2-naphthoate octaprenyltransferase
MSLKRWILATRPWSLVMTFVSVSLSGILAYGRGYFNIPIFIATMLGLMLAHLASNMTNDYFDVKHGVDNLNSPTSQYRRHPLLTGDISLKNFKTAILGMYLAALSLAIFLAWSRGFIVLIFTALGLFFGLFYTADPVVYKHRSLGEFAVFLVWGPLMVGGGYYVLTGLLDIVPMLVSTPVGLLVALVLLANNLRDAKYDESMGVKTIAVTTAGGLNLFKGLIILVYASTILLILARYLSFFSLITFLSLKEALDLINVFEKQIPPAADPITAQLALHYGILLLIGQIIGEIIKFFI